ncbi:retinal cone rhodopsin-sensitive cGMP 3',5'-cyclic phosphodiesterase subunit gamma-like [Melanotaenia boesemani]|uniref:retinal cone rhodopsin-sensitive cGMP 3',5'-cyclic phosphodiesterase subunit gamma-like n=1 Tax=Melanotaenia boesemani TaxID=1250792 RepID=UPI001C048BED|nr:retinal cone rhodopsin-sensitive cGMP 3',5'-cyclic phosphodiesterase subunit gamma-like [Melanotaenia boesemani]
MNSTTMTSEGAKPAPPELQQNNSRQFKSKAPKRGQKGINSHDGGMEGLEESAVVCPWEEFEDIELNDVAQFGTA